MQHTTAPDDLRRVGHYCLLLWTAGACAWFASGLLPKISCAIFQEEEYRQAALAAPQQQPSAAPEQALLARIMSGVQTVMRVRNSTDDGAAPCWFEQR